MVLYRSTSGFTKKYAQWIAEELHADLYDAKNFDAAKFADFQVIVFGGSLHAVGISGIKLIKENLIKLSDKKVIVFAVGASPPRENVLDEVKTNNFSVQQQESISLFYLQGGFNYDKLDHINKFLMALFKIRLQLKKNLTSDEKGMLAAYSKPLDCTRKDNIKPIIEKAKS